MPAPESLPMSLFDKLWKAHVVRPQSKATPAIIYIDLHLVHEVTSPQGFAVLRKKGIGVRCPERTLATLDHSIPTLPAGADGQRPYITQQAHRQVQTLRDNCREFAIELHDWDSPSRGILHVMGPELGATQPGMTLVCGESHTSTHATQYFSSINKGFRWTRFFYSELLRFFCSNLFRNFKFRSWNIL